MSSTGNNPTQEKLRSLRIDPDRKKTGGGAARGLGFLVAGILLGFGGAYVYLQRAGIAPSAAPGTAAAGPAAASSSADGKPAATPAVKPSKPATPKAGETVLTASGYVTPRRRVSLSPQVMGQVVWVGIEKGQRVRKDEVLVRLDDEEYQADLRRAEASVAAAEARLRDLEAGSRVEEIARVRAEVTEAEVSLANAELTFERQRRALEGGGLVSRQVLDDATAARDSARARLAAQQAALALAEAGSRRDAIAAARSELEVAIASRDAARIRVKDTTITAPLDGTVLEKLIEVGELVTPQSFGGSRGARTELLSMADLSDLQVEVDINEADFAKVTMGQEAIVTLDAYQEQTYRARIREIAPEATRSKATVQVKVQILNPDKLVLPEMGARVDFLAPAGSTDAPAPTPVTGGS